MRSLPVPFDASREEAKIILDGVNGLLLQGGKPPVPDSARYAKNRLENRCSVVNRNNSHLDLVTNRARSYFGDLYHLVSWHALEVYIAYHRHFLVC